MKDTDTGLNAAGIDTSVPQSARMYDYFLGGKDNYPPDWEAAEKVISLFPDVKAMARVNREFMHRASRMMAQRGVSQFLDIGTGIPTRPNLHQVVQDITPSARVVYADNDPIVLRHAEALLHSTPQGKTAYVQAELGESAKVVAAAEQTLDFDRPIALSLVALLHLVPDEMNPHESLEALLRPLASGSYLVLSHATGDLDPETWERVVGVYRDGGTPAQVRSREEFAGFFEGLELISPGIELAEHWYPEPGGSRTSEQPLPLYVGVARKV